MIAAFPIMETALVFLIWGDIYFDECYEVIPWLMPCVPVFLGMKIFKKERPPV